VITIEQRLEIEQALVSHMPVIATPEVVQRMKPFLSILKLALDDVTERKEDKP